MKKEFYINLLKLIKKSENNKIKIYSNNKKEKIEKKEIADFFEKNDIFLQEVANYYNVNKSYSVLEIENKNKMLQYLNELIKDEENKDFLNNLEEITKNKTKNNYNKFANEIRFPEKAINILLYNSTKPQGKINNIETKNRNYLIKSLSSFNINNETITLNPKLFNTISYNFFSNEKIKISFKGTIVLIENKESFEFADKIFDPHKHLFILYGGTASEKEHDFFANNVYAEAIIYYGDIDYVSLNEYNKLRKKINNLKFFIKEDPKNIEKKLKKYGNSELYDNQEIDYNNIRKNFDEITKLLWRIIEKYEKGLEQEIFHAPIL